MISRELEPELMDDPSESQAYDDMDHGAVNKQFVCDFLDAGVAGTDVLDLGTGTARIPIELCEQDEKCRVLATDAAISMLEIARINVAISGFETRIQLHHGDSKALGFEDAMFDSAISNSLLHHLADPQLAITEIVRLVRPGGRIFVRDLMRPASMEAVDALVTSYTSDEDESAQQLFRQSLIAALSSSELIDLIRTVGFSPDTVQETSDRHVTWSAIKQ